MTEMKLKVDLGCERCYKKIKKLICEIPAIKEWAYNEKEHTVVIKVVCCSPEKIRQKLIRKGGHTIKSIEIIKPVVPKVVKPPPTDTPKKPPVTEYPPCVYLYPFPFGVPVCCNRCLEVRGCGGGGGCGCGCHSTSNSECHCDRSYAYCCCEIYTYNEPPSVCAIM